MDRVYSPHLKHGSLLQYLRIRYKSHALISGFTVDQNFTWALSGLAQAWLEPPGCLRIALYYGDTNIILDHTPLHKHSKSTGPQEILMEKLTVLVSELVSILKGCHSNDELLGHVLLTVSTLVDNHLAAMEESHRTELKIILHDKLKTLSPSEHKVPEEVGHG